MQRQLASPLILFDQFQKLATDNSHESIQYDSKEGKLEVKAYIKEDFIFVEKTNLAEQLQAPIKLHVNFGTLEIAKGWSIVSPIFLKYANIFGCLKLIDPALLIKTTVGSEMQVALDEIEAKKISDPDEQKFVLENLECTKQYFAAERKRFLESAPITDYIYKDENGKVDTTNLLAMAKEIETELKAHGAFPTSLNQTDLRVNSFVSIRQESDQFGYYINVFRNFLPECWHALVNNPDVKALVDEKELSRPRPQFKSEPYQYRAAGWNRDVENFGSIVSQLKKSILYLEALQKNNKLSKSVQECVRLMNQILHFKSLDQKEKLAAIVSVCEDAYSSLTEHRFRDDNADEKQVVPLEYSFNYTINHSYCCGLFGDPPEDKNLGDVLTNFFKTIIDYNKYQSSSLANDIKDENKTLSKLHEMVMKENKRQTKGNTASI